MLGDDTTGTASYFNHNPLLSLMLAHGVLWLEKRKVQSLDSVVFLREL